MLKNCAGIIVNAIAFDRTASPSSIYIRSNDPRLYGTGDIVPRFLPCLSIPNLASFSSSASKHLSCQHFSDFVSCRYFFLPLKFFRLFVSVSCRCFFHFPTVKKLHWYNSIYIKSNDSRLYGLKRISFQSSFVLFVFSPSLYFSCLADTSLFRQPSIGCLFPHLADTLLLHHFVLCPKDSFLSPFSPLFLFPSYVGFGFESCFFLYQMFYLYSIYSRYDTFLSSLN